MKLIIQANQEDVQHILEEEQYNFIREVLSKIDLPIEDCLPKDIIDFTVLHKIKFRYLLDKVQVVIQENSNGDLNIVAAHNIIATWHKPELILREDLKYVGTKNQFYMEIILDSWSVFEGENT